MPSGIVHARATAFLAVPSFFVGLGAHNWQAGAACAVGCLSGVLLSPDLDQETISTSENWLIKKTLGLGFLWTMIWYPYALAIKHRSPLSHFPILGTAGRLFYMAIFGAIAWRLGWQPPSFPVEWLAWAVAGLALSDFAHWYMDVRLGEKRRKQ